MSNYIYKTIHFPIDIIENPWYYKIKITNVSKYNIPRDEHNGTNSSVGKI